MAKIGMEVEGIYKNINMRTMFVNAEEFLNGLHWPGNVQDVDQLYISDHEGVIDIYDDAKRIHDALNDFAIITVELREFKRPPIAHPNLEFMLYVAPCGFQHAPLYRTQIKLEHNLTVRACPLEQFIKTEPEDFAGDITLE